MTGKRGAIEPSLAERSIRRYLIGGSVVALALIVGMGGIAATTELSGAVIAQGVFVVDSHVKKVQHPTGGIVGKLFVRDGDPVRENDLLLRLDDTQTRTNLAIIVHRLDQLEARRARLLAERDDLDHIEFPKELQSRADRDREVADQLTGEARLFELRRSARAGQKAQLEARIVQLQKEDEGLRIQETAKVKEIELVARELDGLKNLWRKNLITMERITRQERDSARINGEHGQLLAAQAQVEGKISEVRLQIIQIDQDLRSEVAKDLREIEAQAGEQQERKVAAEDQLNRIDVRAPQAGVVHQLAVHTIGGVIAPGEQIMLVVPVTDALKVEAHIAPQDIDQVQTDQLTTLRLSAFNQRITPEVEGKVADVSPDLTQDPKTGSSYYTARIVIPPSEIAKIAGLKIVPGMPAEAFIQTRPRTILSYLVKPLSDQIEHAFREE